MLYGVEIEEKVANKGLIDLGDYIANLVILDICVQYYPEILLLNIYIYIQEYPHTKPQQDIYEDVCGSVICGGGSLAES